MKNFIQVGDTVTVAAPSGGATSGAPVVVGTLVGVAVHAYGIFVINVLGFVTP
jgi:predicted RecA/RadA family phage recombinase